jgi:hypothetical protein
MTFMRVPQGIARAIVIPMYIAGILNALLLATVR